MPESGRDIPGKERVLSRFPPSLVHQVGSVLGWHNLDQWLHVNHSCVGTHLSNSMNPCYCGPTQSQAEPKPLVPALAVGRGPAPLSSAIPRT
jgi:hypothetical protein